MHLPCSSRFNYSPDFDELKEAIIARDSRKIGAVLRRQPNLAQASDAVGNNALHWSVITRQVGLIERFAALGTPIDGQRADGQTPVLIAVNGGCNSYRAARDRSHPSIRNRFVMVGYLLARGAKYTISVAAAVGDQERIEQLLHKDPGLASRLDSARESPLSYASQGGYLHIVRLLLEQGADPNIAEGDAPDGLALCARIHGKKLYEVMLRADGSENGDPMAPRGPESTQRIPRQVGRRQPAFNASTSTGRRKDCAFRDQRRWSRATDSRQMVTIDRWFFSVRDPEGNSAGVRAAETRRSCRAPNLITIGEAIPPPSISKVAQNSPNPDRLS